MVSSKLKLNLTNCLYAILAAAMFIIVFSAPASAQITLQLGGDADQQMAMLAQRGYNRIELKASKITETEFYACKDGKRYIIDVKWNGRIKTTVIGKCRIEKFQAQIVRDLRNQGYERITIEDRAGKYLAVVCKENQRSRLEINRFGDVTRERVIGRCRNELTPVDITAMLEEKGYNRITFTDRQLPKYVAEACLRREKQELILNRFGEIKSTTKIGRCRSRVDPKKLTSLLEDRGYTNVMIIRDRLPRYLAVGCKDNAKMEITINRFGQITDQYKVGTCQRAFTSKELAEAMADQGYKRINVTADGDRFIARGCLDGRLNEITLTKFGKLIDRKENGGCNSPKMHKLADTLRDRGMSNLEFSVTGCEKGKKYRILFDEYANRIEKTRIGKCSN